MVRVFVCVCCAHVRGPMGQRRPARAAPGSPRFHEAVWRGGPSAKDGAWEWMGGVGGAPTGLLGVKGARTSGKQEGRTRGASEGARRAEAARRLAHAHSRFSRCVAPLSQKKKVRPVPPPLSSARLGLPCIQDLPCALCRGGVCGRVGRENGPRTRAGARGTLHARAHTVAASNTDGTRMLTTTSAASLPPALWRRPK